MLQSPIPNPQSLKDRPAIFVWLCLCAFLVAAMVCIGGYTRLSGSGLSITEWKPIHGVIPPLGEAQWQEEFAGYRQSPQYLKVNMGMTLEQFKTIFWPEFFHRLLGRAVGVIFFLPMIPFLIRGSFTRRFTLRMAGIFALGGFQGVIGWLMVKSGLVDAPHVSHIRLALHLSIAFTIFALIVWAALDVQARHQKAQPVPASYKLWFALLCVQIILGALVAGLHAGLLYNTWPDMNGYFLPPDALSEHPVLVQFIHRTLAVLLAFFFILWWYWRRAYVKSRRLGGLCACVTAVIAAQFTLGVLTLLHMVPLGLALAHQMTALLLFTVSVALMHRMKWNDHD